MRRKFVLIPSVLVILAIAAVVLITSFGRAASTTPQTNWLGGAPTITKEIDYAATPSLTVDKCIHTNVQISGSSGFNDFCMVPTAMGLMTQLFTNWGYVKPTGYDKAYRVDFLQGGNPIVQPVPNQASGVYWSAGNNGSFAMGLFYQISNHMELSGFPFQQYFNVTKPTPDVLFRYPNGDPIRFSGEYNFSNNGRYMTAYSNQGVMRINLMNPNVQFFAPTVPVRSASTAQEAIDESGQYGITSYVFPDDLSHATFKMVDIDSCNVPSPANNDTVTTIQTFSSCNKVDFFPAIKQIIPTIQTIRKVQFVNDRTFTFVAGYKDAAGTMKYSLYSLTANGQSRSLKQYLALGDSYISGEGAYDYRAGTDTSRNQCHQSLLSYPYLLGANQSSFASVACSGAKMHNVSSSGKERVDQLVGDVAIPEEIAQAKLTDLPGVNLQRDLVDKDNPDAITISIGGNDIGFGSILEKCVHPLKQLQEGTCYDTYEDRVEVLNTINSQFPRLKDLYTGLKDNGTGGRRVYVIGYPQIAKVGGDCGVNVQMNAQEVGFAHDLIGYLDSVIKRAADEAGVMYVDTENAFDGHRLCEVDGSQSAMNGFTISKSVGGGYDVKASFHPNQRGHQMLADVIALQTANLTKPMPVPASQTNQVVVNPAASVLQNIVKTNRTVRLLKLAQGLVSDLVTSSSTMSFTVKASDYSTRPGATYTMAVNSTPVGGNFVANTAGDVNISAVLPANSKPGFNTLHVYGTDVFNNPIDIQQVFFVAVSNDDNDGDGVPNTQDSCILAVQSGTDADHDGIDDACDPVIAEQPVANPNPEPAGIIWQDDAVLPIAIQGVSGP